MEQEYGIISDEPLTQIADDAFGRAPVGKYLARIRGGCSPVRDDGECNRDP